MTEEKQNDPLGRSLGQVAASTRVSDIMTRAMSAAASPEMLKVLEAQRTALTRRPPDYASLISPTQSTPTEAYFHALLRRVKAFQQDQPDDLSVFGSYVRANGEEIIVSRIEYDRNAILFYGVHGPMNLPAMVVATMAEATLALITVPKADKEAHGRRIGFKREQEEATAPSDD